MIGIYKITSPSNRVYIGQSSDIEKRFNIYKNIPAIKKQTRLYSSFLKYGYINHKFEIIEECNFEELNIRERYWQEHYNVLGKEGLNCLLTETNILPRVNSEETKQKKSLASIGNKSFSGKTHTEEWSKHMSSLLKEKYKNEPHKTKGTKYSDEVVKKMTDNHPNRKLVLDTQYGIFYDSARIAAETLGINYSTLRDKLQGKYVNNTNLIYC